MCMEFVDITRQDSWMQEPMLYTSQNPEEFVKLYLTPKDYEFSPPFVIKPIQSV